jgi:hypothetical protein
MKLRTCALCDLTAGEPVVMPGKHHGNAVDRCVNLAACGRRRRKAAFLKRQGKRKQLEESRS